MIKKDSFRGRIPATITPMKKNYEFDVDAYDSYLKWIVKQGVVGLAINVDTGELPTLTSDERVTLLKIARERLGNSRVLVAGLSATSLIMAKEEAHRAKDVSVDAILVFPNPAFLGYPQDSEAIGHFHSAIADAVDIDLVLFQLQDKLRASNSMRTL